MKKSLVLLSLIMAASLFFTSCSCDFLPPKDEAENSENDGENSQDSEESDDSDNSEDSEEKIVYKYIYEECDEEDCECECDFEDYEKNEDENEPETSSPQTSTENYSSKPEIDDSAYYWWYCDNDGFCEDSYGNKWDNTVTL